MPTRTEQDGKLHVNRIDKMFVRIVDTYEYGEEVSYGIAHGKTPHEPGAINWRRNEYYLITRPDGREEIHPIYACTEITKKEYFVGVLKGNV